MLDLLIKNGTIVDGTGKDRYIADLGVKGGYICTIRPNVAEAATTIIDASGKIVAPGFIDIHSHSDLCPFIPGLDAQSKLYQGITLEVIGNCGMSNLPVDDVSRCRLTQYMTASLDMPLRGVGLEDDSITDYAKHINNNPAAVNVGVLIGHGTLRGHVVGMDMRKPTAAEQFLMEKVLDRELSRGAFGMSLGLIYPPSSYADSEELVGLAKVLKRHEAILSVHLRSESTGIFSALDEIINVTEKTNVHLQISHLKLMGKSQWGEANRLIHKIKAARASGLHITCDQYPYIATATTLTAVVPKWAMSGGFAAMCGRLKCADQQLAREIRQEIDNRGGAERILIAFTHGHKIEYEGKKLSEIAQSLHLEPELAVAKILIETEGATTCFYFSLDENDMETIMKEKYIAVGSDGYALPFDKDFLKFVPHPRNYGAFPRFFQLIRDKNLLKLEDAVYKATGLTASILGLQDRGRLLQGLRADIVVFDYERIEDKATYFDSLQRPAGIEMVVLDGQIALLNGKQVTPPFGKVIFHIA